MRASVMRVVLAEILHPEIFPRREKLEDYLQIVS